MAPAIKAAKLGRYVTNSGKALFHSGNTASPFDETKVEATIILDAKGRDDFQAFLDDKLPEALKETGIKKTELNSIFKEDTDKDGNPTGLYRVKAKSKIQYTPRFVDGHGKEFTPAAGFTVPNGATIKLSLGVEVMKMSTFTGIVLRLQGTKILEVPNYELGFEQDDSQGDFSYGAVPETTKEDGGDEIPW